MDIQAYIQSGVIESYVLGMADDQEAAELEQLSREYPAIRQALEAFEADLERAALAAAMPPPPQVKEKLFASLSINNGDEQKMAKVVAMPKTFSLAKLTAAAAIILLIVSAALNVYFFTQLRSSSTAYQALLSEKAGVTAQNNIMQTKMLDMYQGMQLMSDPVVAKVPMPGVKGKENSLATVFWDSKSKDVYVLANRLPQAPAGMEYQLWAIVDNKPVDAGMMGDCAGLCKMKNIPKASHFAITLEKKGGSPTPTMDQMYVFGKAG